MNKTKIYRLMQIGIINTLRINIKYFGLISILCPPILCSKKVKLNRISGEIEILNTKRCGMIRIGFPSVAAFDYKNSRTVFSNSGKITFNGTASIGQGSSISNSGQINFGDKFNISANTTIIARNSIFFGDNCLISWDCLIMDSDWHKIYNEEGDYINPNKPIRLRGNNWIGCRCTILKGADIADGCVIAAGSIVSKQLHSPQSIYSNNTILKSSVTWNY